MRPEVSSDGAWVTYTQPDGSRLTMPVVKPQPCPPRLRAPDMICVRCPHCGEIHAHGAEEGTRLAHCAGHDEVSEYYLRLATADEPYLPRGWFESIDGPY